MEESAENHQPPSPANFSASGMGKSKLRFPLRSSSVKPKQEKSPQLRASSSSVPRRGTSAAVSQSVNASDLSRKERSVNPPPRRLSIDSNPGLSTPSTQASVRKSLISQGKTIVPLSEVSKSSSTRTRFSVLSSASYWLSQIKLSETAGKHSISLGFFKLAFDAGSEPLHLLRDELKCYVRKHDLAQVGETVASLFENYDIEGSLEQLKISHACTQVGQEGTHKLRPISGTKKLRPKSLNVETQASSPKSKRNAPAPKIRSCTTGNSSSIKPAAESGSGKVWKKIQKPDKQEPEPLSGQVKVKKQQKEAATGEVEPVDMETTGEDKENMDVSPVEEDVVVMDGK